MESPLRKALRRNDYNRHKVLRLIKRRNKAKREQEQLAAEKELRKRLRMPKYDDGKPLTVYKTQSGKYLLGNTDEEIFPLDTNIGGDESQWQFKTSDGRLVLPHTQLYAPNTGEITQDNRSWFNKLLLPVWNYGSELGYKLGRGEILTGKHSLPLAGLAAGVATVAEPVVGAAFSNPYVNGAFALDAAYRQGFTDEGWRKTLKAIQDGRTFDAVKSGVGDVLDLTMMAPTAYRGFKLMDEFSRELFPTYDYYRMIKETNPTIKQLTPVIENVSDYSKSDDVRSIHFNDAKSMQQPTKSTSAINLERDHPNIKLKRKAYDTEFDKKYGDINTQDDVTSLLSSNEMNRKDLARLKKRAKSLGLSDDIISQIDDAIDLKKIQILKGLSSYKDIIKMIFKGDSEGSSRAFLHLIDNEEVKLKINELYNRDVSENLRNILRNSYDPITGTWNRDENVISMLANGDRKTLGEFYRLLSGYDRGNASTDLSNLLKYEKYANDIKNGTFAGIHDAMTHNKYGEGNTLIERIRQSLLGYSDVGRISQETFGGHFSPNSVLINLKGLENAIKLRTKFHGLPILKSFDGDAALNTFGKVKFLDDDGNYTALMGSVTDDKKALALLGIDGGPQWLHPITGAQITGGDVAKAPYGIYRPSAVELEKEGFKTIEEYNREIQEAYNRVVNAYNSHVDAYPNIFTDKDKMMFDSEMFNIHVPSDIHDIDDRVPSIIGPNWKFRMDLGKNPSAKFSILKRPM